MTQIAIRCWVVLIGLYLGFSAQMLFAEGPFDVLQLDPELLMRNRDSIGLSDEQVKSIRGRLEQANVDATELRRQANEASQKLARVLSKDDVDTDTALKHLDAVLEAERQQKRLHLQIMLGIRSDLTENQRQVVARMKNQGNPIQQRLASKVAKIENQVANRKSDPLRHNVRQQLDRFQKLMQAGNTNAAERLLDSVIANLSGTGTATSVEPNDEERTPAKLPGTTIKPLSPKAVERQVQAMKAENAAWRKIAWKSCLLEGLKSSKEQRKPVILWVFIDRPIDDERC